MNENTINLNSAECIKEVRNIGNTVYQNICDGTSSVVPWGSADWINGMIIILFLAMGIIALVSMAKVVHSEW